jgi:hypothetical protein
MFYVSNVVGEGLNIESISITDTDDNVTDVFSYAELKDLMLSNPDIEILGVGLFMPLSKNIYFHVSVYKLNDMERARYENAKLAVNKFESINKNEKVFYTYRCPMCDNILNKETKCPKCSTNIVYGDNILRRDYFRQDGGNTYYYVSVNKIRNNDY